FVTGFSLRFSDIPVFQMLTAWLSEGVRALVHRIAGVIMILLFGAHFIRIVMGRADRGVFLAMLPKPKDIRDFKENMKYIFLRTEKRPNFGKVSYIEKMEYLALIWGTLVMVLTGLILWFPTESLHLLPAWAIKASETIHFMEAILATLAIIFWHFFFVIAHPDAYPLDFTFIDGKMPVEEVKHARPDWYEELKDKGKID
ncbi:MAG: cytochrome b/b6 domain-containing protein, partial [Holophagae bacterium]|nr:cytochrome b/b6 domain-containing protein [Holophagae bacterium]